MRLPVRRLVLATAVKHTLTTIHMCNHQDTTLAYRAKEKVCVRQRRYRPQRLKRSPPVATFLQPAHILRASPLHMRSSSRNTSWTCAKGTLSQSNIPLLFVFVIVSLRILFSSLFLDLLIRAGVFLRQITMGCFQVIQLHLQLRACL